MTPSSSMTLAAAITLLLSTMPSNASGPMASSFRAPPSATIHAVRASSVTATLGPQHHSGAHRHHAPFVGYGLAAVSAPASTSIVNVIAPDERIRPLVVYASPDSGPSCVQSRIYDIRKAYAPRRLPLVVYGVASACGGVARAAY